MTVKELSEAAKVRSLTKLEFQFLILSIMADGRPHRLNVVFKSLEAIDQRVLDAETIVKAHQGPPTPNGKCQTCELGSKILERKNPLD